MSFILNFIKEHREAIYVFAGYTALFLLFRITFFYALPFLTGFGFAAIMQPVYRHLCKSFKFKSSFSASVVTTMIFLILISIVCILAASLTNQLLIMFSEIMENNQTISNAVIGFFGKLSAALSRFDFDFISAQENIMNILTNGLEAMQALSGYVMSAISFFPALAAMVIVSVFATYYFTVNYSKLENTAKKLIEKYKAQKCCAYLNESKAIIKRFLKGYLTVYGLTFIITLVFFLVIHVRFAAVFAVLSAVADVLPVLGPSLVYIPLAVIYCLQGKGQTAIIILAGFAIICVIRQFLEPKIVSKSISIPPLANIAAAYFALLAKSLWLLIYLMLLFMLISVYNTVRKKSLLTDKPS